MANAGKDYEDLVGRILEPKCSFNGYGKRPQSPIGLTPWGTVHVVDWEIWEVSNPGRRALLSCKHQDSGGTAQEKVPYEAIKLAKALDLDPRFKVAWLVLGGDGWTSGLREYYLSGLELDIPQIAGRVFVLSTDQLISHRLLIPH